MTKKKKTFLNTIDNSFENIATWGVNPTLNPDATPE